MENKISISLEFTPNPSTLKYVVEQTLLERGAVNFPNRESAEKSPLAKRLFEIVGVVGVMVGKNFITVTKGSDGDWESVNNGVNSVLKDHLSKNLSIVDEQAIAQSGHASSNNELEEKIKTILDNDIRPAVAMDGGDITFDHYENGIVYLSLQGSCSGCPSSTATLKAGIERRLKEAIPEIQEVVSI